jgi:virulence-associated protein VapD
MTRSQAEIKFVLQQGAVPVSNAKVAVLTDTATTSNLGIARIRNLNVPSNFEYHIYKSGFRDVMGSVYLRTDTTLNIQMEMIPVNASGFEKTENLRIWPNPVDEVLFLSSSESIAGYSVYNLAGSKIKVESSAVNGIIQLDFSRVIAGIYFIEISFVNHRNVTRKIIRK